MPVCQTCGKTWPADHAVCPEDGTRLSPPSQPTVGSLAPQLASHGSNIRGGGYDDDLEAGSIAGEYQIEKKIGEGGMGAVYGARHPLIGKRAAIKVLRRELSSNPEAVDRFVREAQAVNQIGHPNIVDVFSFGTLPDGRSFFAMEWLQGEPLRARLERPLTYAEAIDVLDTMAKALVAAHDAGVVHRDLKPDNVFLVDVKEDKPVVMLLDFGLAKLTGTTDGGRVERTRTGVVMGTPLYISPEQAKGTTIGAATDTYALGVIAYEMFTGRCPFLADSAVEIMSLHITQAAIPPTSINPALPAAIDQLVLGMMAKDPAARPSLGQVRKQLAELRGLAAGGVPVGSSTNPGQWPIATPVPSSYSVGPAAIAPARAPSDRASSPLVSPGSMAPGSMAPGSFANSAIAPPAKRGRSIGLILGIAVVLGGAAIAAVIVLGNKGDKNTDNAVVGSNDPVSGSASGTSPGSASLSGSASGMSGSASGTSPGSASLAGSAATTPTTPATPTTPTTPAKTPTAKTGTGTTKVATGDPIAKSTAPGKVLIVLSGSPKGGIFVDGKLLGRGLSQATVMLSPGAHRVRGQAPGYPPQVVTIEVKAGGNQTVTIPLKRGAGGVNGVLDPFGNDN